MHRARVSGPTRPTRPTNPRLLANPSHRHKRLLIYCHSLLPYFPVTYCCPRYIFFAQDGVPEPEVVQKRPFISTDAFTVILLFESPR